jgi:hypothetical protein
MIKSFFKSKHPKVQPTKNKLTFNHISFITTIDDHGNIKIESFDSPLLKITEDNKVILPSFWTKPKFIDSFKLFGSSKLNDIEVNLTKSLIWRLLDYPITVNQTKNKFEKWLFESTERFIQRKQIIELLLDKTIEYINQQKSFYEEITKEPDIELKLSDQEYEELKRQLFG